MATVLKQNENQDLETSRVGSAFFDPETLPWLPWVMEGTFFKLMAINPQTGGFTMFLRVTADNVAPVHGHLGAVEGIITKGGFGYGDDRGREGHYILEAGGLNHIPDTDSDGMEMFAIAYAPIVGLNDEGGIDGIVDAKFMYQMARDGGAADHLTPSPHWTDI
ncbi:MAG: cupin domain-containing protein [Pseudomonadota bacterium]